MCKIVQIRDIGTWVWTIKYGINKNHVSQKYFTTFTNSNKAIIIEYIENMASTHVIYHMIHVLGPNILYCIYLSIQILHFTMNIWV
jgi:hypothetical protein